MIQECRFNTVTKALLVILTAFFIFIGLQAWHPLQRGATAFTFSDTSPLILPIEAVRGDIIVYMGCGREPVGLNSLVFLEIKHDARIDSLNFNKINGRIEIDATMHYTLWEYLIGVPGKAQGE